MRVAAQIRPQCEACKCTTIFLQFQAAASNFYFANVSQNNGFCVYYKYSTVNNFIMLYFSLLNMLHLVTQTSQK